MPAANSGAGQEAETNRQVRVALASQMQQLTSLLTRPAASTPSPALAPAPLLPIDVPEPRGTPQHYDKDPGACGPFLTNCHLLLFLTVCLIAATTRWARLNVDHHRVGKTVSSLASFQSFAKELCKAFCTGSNGHAARERNGG